LGSCPLAARGSWSPAPATATAQALRRPSLDSLPEHRRTPTPTATSLVWGAKNRWSFCKGSAAQAGSPVEGGAGSTRQKVNPSLTEQSKLPGWGSRSRAAALSTRDGGRDRPAGRRTNATVSHERFILQQTMTGDRPSGGRAGGCHDWRALELARGHLATCEDLGVRSSIKGGSCQGISARFHRSLACCSWRPINWSRGP
jgi:hypothetical protein